MDLKRLTTTQIFLALVKIYLQMIAYKLHEVIDVKDRTYNLRTYNDCFIGSQIFDFLLDHDFANSRLTALRIGQVLMTICKFYRSLVAMNLLDSLSDPMV